MAEKKAAVRIPFVENLFAPEVFASEAVFFATAPGVLTIVFTSFRFDLSTAPSAQKRVVVGRLVMPIAGAQSLAVGLFDYLKKSGLDPAPTPSDPTQVQ